jgi:hypothetical protein
VYPEAFERAWAAYPKRPGNPKKAAHKAWSARLRAGATEDEILAGVERYRHYVEVTNTEKRYVKMAASFFGPNDFFREPWTTGNGGGESPYMTPAQFAEAEREARDG